MNARDDVAEEVALVALGTSGSWTGAGRACSGYLVEAGVLDDHRAARSRVLFDAGNGATVNLQRYARFDELDAIFISHRHPDHWVDLISVFTALRLDANMKRAPLPLYAPADVPSAIMQVLSPSASEHFDDIFDVHPIVAGDRVIVGAKAADPSASGVEIEVFEALHSVPAAAFRVTAYGRTIAYSGDTAPCDGVRACASGADLFACEATWQGPAEIHPVGSHLTATQAGHIAREARVGQLVLTHIGSGLDPEVSVVEAQAAFGGRIVAANDLDRWVLSGRR